VRNVRADARLAGLPVVMITSRIAQKHRDYAAQLGVDHYLGKPYSEEELLQLVARYAGAAVAAGLSPATVGQRATQGPVAASDVRKQRFSGVR
jgi:DNA-binding response OmpR family regulator